MLCTLQWLLAANGMRVLVLFSGFGLRLQPYNPARTESITGISVQSVTSARSDDCLQDNQTQQLDSPRLFILMLAIKGNLHHVEKLLIPATLFSPLSPSKEFFYTSQIIIIYPTAMAHKVMTK